MDLKKRAKIDAGDQFIALYHVVYRHETFEDAATMLFKLVQGAQKTYPNKRRVLYLDIEGHRNSQGGFDSDMFELQQDFLIGCLGRFLSEFHCPLINARNPKEQDNDIPPFLVIQAEEDQKA
jgi:hypothetical protein